MALTGHQGSERIVGLLQLLLQAVFQGLRVVRRENKGLLGSCLAVQGKPPQPPLELLFLPRHMEQRQSHMLTMRVRIPVLVAGAGEELAHLIHVHS